MLAHVSDQIGRLAKGFAAHDAFVRLLTFFFYIRKTNKQKQILVIDSLRLKGKIRLTSQRRSLANVEL